MPITLLTIEAVVVGRTNDTNDGSRHQIHSARVSKLHQLSEHVRLEPVDPHRGVALANVPLDLEIFSLYKCKLFLFSWPT